MKLPLIVVSLIGLGLLISAIVIAKQKPLPFNEPESSTQIKYTVLMEINGASWKLQSVKMKLENRRYSQKILVDNTGLQLGENPEYHDGHTAATLSEIEFIEELLADINKEPEE